MTTSPTMHREHPLTAMIARLHTELDGAVNLPVWALGSTETGQVLASLTRLGARVAAWELRVAAQASSVAVEDQTGATSTANWWAHQTRATRAETHHKTRLAAALEAHPVVVVALGAGRVLPDQAAVVVDAVDALPEDLDAELRDRAEAHLLQLANEFDAKALRRLGKGLLSVLAPEVGEAHEAALLAREEREAAASARLSMVDDGHGRVHGRFTLPSLQGAMLKKALLALAAPKHQAATTGRAAPLRPGPEKLGAAFAEYVERCPADRLPAAGGVHATVVVTMHLDTLTGSLKSASLDTGETLSPGQARRLACEAGIIPTVLGGQSQVLDLGRTRRFHTRAQRIALGLRDRGCTGEGCD
ncbi:MAG: 13E12 repeat family protein [Nocardioides sp.]|nr:13E12 repeat family protein [Nocardioides sp.]